MARCPLGSTYVLLIAGALECLNTSGCARAPSGTPVATTEPVVIASRNMTLTAHADEALDALAVIEAPTDQAAQEPWSALRRTEAFQRLHEREAAMGRDFTDSAFRAFLRSTSTHDNAKALRQTLESWRTADLGEAVRKAGSYLPPSLPVRASLYFMIKPRSNTFVFETETRPAIFVAIDTSLSAGAFANEIAHELHHVGYATACKGKSDTAVAEPLRSVVNWMGAFGEGWAMLAAAGGPNVHPHATSDSTTRARWDRHYADAPAQLRELEHFFQDVLEKRLTTPDSIQQAAMSFFGVQGPWYTVGYLMARTIETTYGRPRLMRVLCDPVALTREYQRAAREINGAGGALPVWSDEVLRRLGP